MLTKTEDFDMHEPAVAGSVGDTEQDLLFLGIHSTTGKLLVQFVEGEEMVAFEITTPTLRTKMLSLLIDGVGESLEQARASARYTPKPGDVVTTSEVPYQMTVESFNEFDMTCALVGFAPGSEELTRLDRVCAMELTPATAAE